jgi:starch synthase
MPGFANISGTDPGLTQRFDASKRVHQGLSVPFGSGRQSVDVFRVDLPQSQGAPAIVCYLLRCPEVFDTSDKDSPETAILFCRAVVEFLRVVHDYPVDLVHCNDWHTGLIPVYLKTLYRDDPALARIATVYTTHNAEAGYQGQFPQARRLLELAGLDPATVFQSGRTASLEHYGQFNFCKAGFGFADVINTVSIQYRQELLTPAFGGGLSGVLNERSDRFYGIINGIDTNEWDPEVDQYIQPHNYSRALGPMACRKAKRNLRALLREWQAASGIRPYAPLRDESVVIGIVSRIDYQKTEILVRALEAMCQLSDVQVVLLGTSGRGDSHGIELVHELSQIAARHPHRLLFYNGFDIPLSHMVYAASELFVVPSVFEPCGLTQLVAMRYGAVPIVRAVGGLRDTVIDAADRNRRDQATGFQFKETMGATADDPRMDRNAAADMLVTTVQRALAMYKNVPARWDDLITNGMSQELSWEKPGLQYVELYRKALQNRV